MVVLVIYLEKYFVVCIQLVFIEYLLFVRILLDIGYFKKKRLIFFEGSLQVDGKSYENSEYC